MVTLMGTSCKLYNNIIHYNDGFILPIDLLTSSYLAEEIISEDKPTFGKAWDKQNFGNI